MTRTRLGRRAIIALVTLVAVSTGAAACSGRPATPSGPLTVRNAWARPADSGAIGGAYVTITNTDTVSLTLTGWQTPLAAQTDVHETMQMEGMTHMMARTDITLPRDSSLVMAPGGVHVMLTGLTRALRTGDTIPLTVTLRDGRTVPMRVPVRDAATTP
ncbi:MAG: copper chaperone PCu(A)C [Gemmatimonadaceae bacterium]